MVRNNLRNHQSKLHIVIIIKFAKKENVKENMYMEGGYVCIIKNDHLHSKSFE